MFLHHNESTLHQLHKRVNLKKAAVFETARGGQSTKILETSNPDLPQKYQQPELQLLPRFLPLPPKLPIAVLPEFLTASTDRICHHPPTSVTLRRA
jgi:hypothetical protein